MTISEILNKMIDYSEGNTHDINHFMMVWGYARTIGKLENLSDEMQFLVETAAIVHDIACPLCREKYGTSAAPYQEIEGIPLAGEFLKDTGMTEEQIERVKFIVGHHHTFSCIDGIDFQILVEADYIVNAIENGYSSGNIRKFTEKFFVTDSGKHIVRSLFGI